VRITRVTQVTPSEKLIDLNFPFADVSHQAKDAVEAARAI